MGSEDRQEQASTEEAPPSDFVGWQLPPEEMPGEEAPRMSPGRFNRIAALVLLVVAIVVTGALLWPWKPPPPPEEVSTPTPPKYPLHTLIGDSSAKVQVVAALPVEAACKDHIGVFIAAVAEKHPSMVSVKIADMGSDEGQLIMEEYGIACATVLINGERYFSLGPEVRDQFELKGPSLFANDVRRALAFELEKVYGDSAPELPAAVGEEQPSPY